MKPPARKLSHAKELYYILCIVAVIVGALFSVWGPGGYVEMRKAREELEARHARVKALEKEIAERYERILKLQSDPAAMEELARQKNFGREGEIVQPVAPPPAPGAKQDKR